ncbi:MAG: hypothetical protein ABSF95_10745 [Verrucomicrobiota bacterium]
MKPVSEVPHEALDLHYNSGGFLPDIGLYRHGDMFHHGPSRSHFWLLGVMLVGTVVVALLPWHTKAAVGELKYWIAGMFLFGGLCDIVPHLIRNAVGQQVSIDPKNKTVAITGSGFNWKLSWRQVVELQMCRQRVPDNSEMNGYQLNLVWRDADGTVRRHCLLKHAIRGFVSRLGRRYQSLFGFTLVDYTRASQPHGAANRGQRIRSETNRTSAAAGSGR